MLEDWSAVALIGVIGVGMSTSLALLVRAVIAALRNPRRGPDTPATSCC